MWTKHLFSSVDSLQKQIFTITNAKNWHFNYNPLTFYRNYAEEDAHFLD
jgi:hypothetical protein